jgi:hypothetical protein
MFQLAQTPDEILFYIFYQWITISLVFSPKIRFYVIDVTRYIVNFS